MKIYIDELPNTTKECLFHGKWCPYPPIIEEPGYWECKIDNRPCDINECKYLQVIGNDSIK